ncbi:MAG: methionyl-tRNA formyltransferase [Candidatus Paceibacterota bacterium]
MPAPIPFVYFGTPEISARVLSILENNGLTPTMVVTAPDKPQGRGQKVSASPVAKWAEERNISVLKPERIDSDFINTLMTAAPQGGWPLFVVFAYGHILPQEVIHLPNHNTLNLHPSLLPKFRGPAPIRSAILEADETGVSIIELDERMDHGPIIAQDQVVVSDWPPAYPELEQLLINAGGKLLAQTIPAWTEGKLNPTPQKEVEATYSHKFTASDGEINLSADPEKNLRKIRAFTDWPKAHFFADGKRVLIKKAHLEEGKLVIDVVQPAGSTEMTYKDYSNQS